MLRDQNRTGKRKLPDDPPMPFAAKHWPSLIIQDGQPQRRVYETAVVSTLRERLRAGLTAIRSLSFGDFNVGFGNKAPYIGSDAIYLAIYAENGRRIS